MRTCVRRGCSPVCAVSSLVRNRNGFYSSSFLRLVIQIVFLYEYPNCAQNIHIRKLAYTFYIHMPIYRNKNFGEMLFSCFVGVLTWTTSRCVWVVSRYNDHCSFISVTYCICAIGSDIGLTYKLFTSINWKKVLLIRCFGSDNTVRRSLTLQI